MRLNPVYSLPNLRNHWISFRGREIKETNFKTKWSRISFYKELVGFCWSVWAITKGHWESSVNFPGSPTCVLYRCHSREVTNSVILTVHAGWSDLAHPGVKWIHYKSLHCIDHIIFTLMSHGEGLKWCVYDRYVRNGASGTEYPFLVFVHSSPPFVTCCKTPV